MRYLYLHGFASGPASRKAQAFRNRLTAAGVALEIPDLAEGDFEHLTISSQLAVIERTLRGEAARLIGSSMGGYLAALYAAEHPEIDRMVLLAPAFGFAERWREMTGPAKIEQWRSTGSMDVYHYGEGAHRKLHYGLLDDALAFSSNPLVSCPVRIFHGRLDTVVPVELARDWAVGKDNVYLTELESDHELLNVLNEITAAALPFLLGQDT